MKNSKISLLKVTTTFGLAFASGLTLAQNRLDPVPQAPRPSTPPSSGVTQQAGVGGDEAFARAGVLELGGSGSYTAADGFNQFSLSPSIGWFFMDNWQITGTVRWIHNKTTGLAGQNAFAILAEPSFHFPFTNVHFGFVGLGVGLATQTNADTGFAVAPRAGYKTLVGRSGVLTLDIRNTFSTTDVQTSGNTTAVTLTDMFAVGAGYTVLW